MGDITGLIHRARDGDGQALSSLFELLYPELRRIARVRLRHGLRDPDLGTTALVNETFVKLCATGRLSATDRAHFLAYVATAMRSIVVDIARAKSSERRGGKAVHVEIDEDDVALIDASAEGDILNVHEALDQIGALDPRLVRIVEMRYFAGLSDPEIASALNITDRTVRRDWQKVRLLLAAALR